MTLNAARLSDGAERDQLGGKFILRNYLGNQMLTDIPAEAVARRASESATKVERRIDKEGGGLKCSRALI